MSSLALSVLQPTTIFNLYCVFSTPQQITPTALSFQLQWFFYWIDYQPAPAVSQTTDRRDVSAVASVRPNQLSTYQISLKKPLRLLFRFSALHYTLYNIHTLKHVENIPDPSKHTYIIFQDFWLNSYCYVNNFILLDISQKLFQKLHIQILNSFLSNSWF